MNKKLLILGALLLMGVITVLPILAIKPNSSVNSIPSWSQQTIIDSNFFGQEENRDLVEISDDPESDLEDKGFFLKAETDVLKLFAKETNFNIAIVDKRTNYVWYSVYPDYMSLGYSGASRFFIESGVTLEYYNLDNILIDDTKSYLSGPRYNVAIDYDYNSVENGFKAHLSFNDLAISFDVLVQIDGDQLKVAIPRESIYEGDVERQVLNLDGSITTRTVSYRIRGIYVFPYFGANNFEINGYGFVPDGSGALIRYDSIPKTTAYIKRIYGLDEGYRNQTGTPESAHLHSEFTASMPVFGVNHGYEQAAFLANVSVGSSASEIHSYPYGYNSYPINTTFFKYLYRERFQITTSSNINDSFQMINSDPFPTDFATNYHFLAGSEANYAGMAKKYREILHLDEREDTDVKMDVSLIGLDYKSGLFGKNYVTMTSYLDALAIADDLLSSGVSEISLNYIGWSRGGYYDNTPVKPRLSGILGGKRDFRDLKDYLESSEIALSVQDNPLLTFSGALGNQVVKKMTLANFATTAESSRLINIAYYRDPTMVSDHFLGYSKKYLDLGIDGFTLSGVGSAAFSYRYKGINHFREDMIKELEAEIANLGEYRLAMSEVNSYLWPYLDQYLETPVEANKYSYITDSIPFIQLVLSGKTAMTSPYVNFVSDYEVFSLRLIEYGVMPAFLLTKAPTHNLRYTNFEYVYTSEYAIWEATVKSMYQRVYGALASVSGMQMINHAYVVPGVAKIDYDGFVTIYVNYTDTDFITDAGVVSPFDYLVVIGS